MRGGITAAGLAAACLEACFAGALASCFDEPAYSLRLCTLDEPCPQGYFCALDGMCHPRADADGLDGGSRPDATAPACGEAIEAEPPPGGWHITLHPLAGDGTIDRARCIGELTTDDNALSFSARTATLSIGAGETLAAVARARRTFSGMTQFQMDHAGGLRMRAGGLPLYDTFRDGARSAVTERKYVHGVQSIVVELAISDRSSHVELSWTGECDAIAEPTPTTWRIRYYRVGPMPDFVLDRGDCLGAETLTAPMFSFEWRNGAPTVLQEIGVTDRFGAEYSAPRTFATTTTANIQHDDGMRLYTDGNLIYEDWTGSQTVRTTATIPAGTNDILIEFFENLGYSGVGFTW